MHFQTAALVAESKGIRIVFISDYRVTSDFVEQLVEFWVLDGDDVPLLLFEVPLLVLVLFEHFFLGNTKTGGCEDQQNERQFFSKDL